MVHELLQHNIMQILKNLGLDPIKNHKIKGYELDVYVAYDGKKIGFICEENKDNLKDNLHEWHSKNEEIGLDSIVLTFYGEIPDDVTQLSKKLGTVQFDAAKVNHLLEKSFEQKEGFLPEFFHELGMNTEEWDKEQEEKKKQEKEKKKLRRKKKKEQEKESKLEAKELKKEIEKEHERSEIEEMDQVIGEGLADEIIDEKRQELDEEKHKQKERFHKLNFSMIIILSVIASATTMRIALLDDDIVRRAGFLFLTLLLLGLIAGGLYYMARRFIEKLSSDRISSLEREIARYESEEQKLEE
ncbi:MAG: hypothetical protein R6V53_04895 [Candidatus Woesearchaeota archaeon]